MRENIVDPKNSRDLMIATVGSFVFFIGIAGNILVVVAVWRKKSLHSTTNFLLVNLATSDITSLVFSPLLMIPKYVSFTNQGSLADFLCMFVFSYHVILTASIVSILTLTVLSVERYHAVVKPMNIGMRLREGTVKYAIVSVWVVGILLTLPMYINSYYKESSEDCRHTSYWTRAVSRTYQVFLILFVVVIAFAITGFSYFHIVREMYFKKNQQNLASNSAAERLRNQRKRRVVKLSLTVTLVFAVFLLPFAVLITMKYFNERAYRSYYKIAAILFFSEAGINPFLYAFQSAIFRHAFKHILKCSCRASNM
ncbi:QRFP-like peptide receptor [Actinia tenebrosa]|uniref:QRFP-like peptide receptor n=1 Tax=Actinia tenebrosa TaxID=6105 RepID=A0A6P8H157_ACTTE|nr:QRFP-like peptide receptor [Actinia tenebrosa]